MLIGVPVEGLTWVFRVAARRGPGGHLARGLPARQGSPRLERPDPGPASVLLVRTAAGGFRRPRSDGPPADDRPTADDRPPRADRARSTAPGGSDSCLAGVALVVGGCLPAPKTDAGREIANLYAVFLAGGVIVAGDRVGCSRRSRSSAADAAGLANRRQTHGQRAHRGLRGRRSRWSPCSVLFGLTSRRWASRRQGTGGVSLRVTAFRWQWQADYADAGVALVGTVDQPLEVVLPVGQPVHVTLDSVDVNHAFYVPAFLFKRDAIPGSPTRSTSQVERARRLSGCVRRVLRHRPRPDAVHDPGRGPGRRSTPGWRTAAAPPRAAAAVSAIDGRVGAGTAAETAAGPAGRFDLLEWLTTTDHKRIGILYIGPSFGFVARRRAAGRDHPARAGGSPAASSSTPRPTTSCSRCTAR